MNNTTIAAVFVALSWIGLQPGMQPAEIRRGATGSTGLAWRRPSAIQLAFGIGSDGVDRGQAAWSTDRDMMRYGIVVTVVSSGGPGLVLLLPDPSSSEFDRGVFGGGLSGFEHTDGGGWSSVGGKLYWSNCGEGPPDVAPL